VRELADKVMAQAKYDEFKALPSDRRGQIGVINAVRVAIGGSTTRRSASAHRRRSSSLRSAAMRALARSIHDELSSSEEAMPPNA